MASIHVEHRLIAKSNNSGNCRWCVVQDVDKGSEGLSRPRAAGHHQGEPRPRPNQRPTAVY